MGVYLKVSRSLYTELLDSREFETGTALCVSAGIIVIVVSLLGFWGLWMKSQFILSLVRTQRIINYPVLDLEILICANMQLVSLKTEDSANAIDFINPPLTLSMCLRSDSFLNVRS